MIARGRGEQLSVGAPRLHSLTGLRWFAALAVFVSHAHWIGERGVALGAAGVSFFFVLSGFVLVWSSPPGDTAARFYRRRLARVYPLYVVTTTAVLVLIVVGVVGTRWPTADAFGSNLLLLQGWFPTPPTSYTPNPPAWTLSVEVLFYAVFPLMALRRGSAHGWKVLAFVGLTWPILLSELVTVASRAATGEGRVFDLGIVWVTHSPLMYLGTFVAGVGLARGMRLGWQPRRPGLLLVLAAAYALALLLADSGASEADLIPLLTPTFGAVIVAVAALERGGWRSWLTGRRMQALGAWSFAFYLVHWAMLHALEPTHGHWTGVSVWLLGALALGMSVLAAAALHHVVEAPLERRLRGTRAPVHQPVAAALSAAQRATYTEFVASRPCNGLSKRTTSQSTSPNTLPSTAR